MFSQLEVFRNRYFFRYLVPLLVCFFVLSFDAYIIHVGRYLDYLALLICLLCVYFEKGWRPLVAVPPVIIFVALYFICLAFLFGAQARHFTGLLFALCCFHVFSLFIERRQHHVDVGIVSVTTLILFLFFVQLVIGRTTGFFIDYNALISDIPSRIHTHEAYNFRPASIFQEPNSFAVFAFLVSVYLLVSLAHGQVFRKLVLALLIIAMFASNSLWGMAASILTLLFALCYRQFRLVWTCVVLLAIASPILVVDNTVQRLARITYDGSFSERYVGAVPKMDEKLDSDSSNQINAQQSQKEASGHKTDFLRAQTMPTKGRLTGARFPSNEVCSEKVYIQRFLGGGLYPNCFQVRGGANGYSYLYDVSGLLGILLAIGTLLYFDRSKYRLITIATIFLFSTFPIVTYAFFAFMLTLIFRGNHSPMLKSAQVAE